MSHIALHFIIPILVALAFYRKHWRYAATIMIATMLVDADHLLAVPIYDPNRCSIGFHPLHTWPMLVAYALLFLMPLAVRKRQHIERLGSHVRFLHLVGSGLLIHMALDSVDCLI